MKNPVFALLTIALSFTVMMQSAVAQQEVGSCKVPAGENTSPDGRCGTWVAGNKINKGKGYPTPSTLIDFSSMPATELEFYTRVIAHVCTGIKDDEGFVVFHTGPNRDILKIWVENMRGVRFGRTWKLNSFDNKKRKKIRCRYFLIGAGMKLQAVITNSEPSITRTDAKAKGTWAIVK